MKIYNATFHNNLFKDLRKKVLEGKAVLNIIYNETTRKALISVVCSRFVYAIYDGYTDNPLSKGKELLAIDLNANIRAEEFYQ